MHGQHLSTPESVVIGDPFLPPALSVQYMEHVNIFMQSFKRNGQNQSQQKGWAVPSALRAFLGFLFFPRASLQPGRLCPPVAPALMFQLQAPWDRKRYPHLCRA